MVVQDLDYIVCGSCKQDFPLDGMTSFIQHKKQECISHPGKSLACQFCQAEFRSAYSLLQHVQANHSLRLFFEKNYSSSNQRQDNLRISHTLPKENNPPGAGTAVRTNSSLDINNFLLQNNAANNFPENILAFGNNLNSSWFAGGESVIPALNLAYGVATQSSQPSEQFHSPNSSITMALENAQMPGSSAQVMGRGDDSLMQDFIASSPDGIRSERDEFSVSPSPSQQSSSGSAALTVPGAGCPGGCKCGCKHNCKQSSQADSSGADAGLDGEMSNASMDTGRICQCSNQGCGITIVPGTHEAMKKCCAEVMPKKRKRHMETKHVPASFLRKFPRKRRVSRYGPQRSLAPNKSHGNEPTTSTNVTISAPVSIGTVSGSSDVDLLLSSSSPFLLPAPVSVSSPSLSGTLTGHDPSTYTPSVQQINVTSTVSSCCRPSGAHTAAHSVEQNMSILHQLADMELPLLADTLVDHTDALISSMTNNPSLLEIPRPDLNPDPLADVRHLVEIQPRTDLNLDPLADVRHLVEIQPRTDLNSDLLELLSPRADFNSDTLELRVASHEAAPGENSATSPSGRTIKQEIEYAVSGARRRQYPTSRPFKCDECHRGFNQRIHLQKHKAKHTGIKPYKCNECDYSTVERSHLKVHMRVHTGEKPYKCPFCDYATAQNSTLKIHLKRRHGEKAEALLSSAESAPMLQPSCVV